MRARDEGRLLSADAETVGLRALRNLAVLLAGCVQREEIEWNKRPWRAAAIA